MKHVGYIMISVFLLFAACDEAKVEGWENALLLAGFERTGISVFENEINGTVRIVLSEPAIERMQFRVGVCEECNIQEGKHYFLTTHTPVVEAGMKSVDVGFTLTDDNVTNDERSFGLRLFAAPGTKTDTVSNVVRVCVLDNEAGTEVGFKESVFSCREQKRGSDVYATGIPLVVSKLVDNDVEVEMKVKVIPMDREDEAKENVHFRLPQKTLRTVLRKSGQSELTFPMEIVDDDEINGNRKFALEIESVIGGYCRPELKRCVVTIENDDVGFIFEKTSFSVEECGGETDIPLRILGSLEEPLSGLLILGGTAENGVDYTMDPDWSIQPGDETLVLKLKPLHREGVSPDRMVEIGIRSEAGIQLIGSEKCSVSILDVDTKISVAEEALMVMNDVGEVEIPLRLERPLEHEVICRVDVKDSKGYRPGQISMAQAEAKIPAGETESSVLLSLHRLESRQRAWVSVGIVAVKGASADTTLCTVDKCFEFSGAGVLSIEDFSSQEEGGEGPDNGYARHAIDGNTDTFWHSCWSRDGFPLPQGVVFGLPDNMHLFGAAVIRRIHAISSDSKTADLYLSKNVNTMQGDWGEPCGQFTWMKPQDAGTNIEKHTSRLAWEEPREAKYLKIVVTEGYRRFAQIAELKIYGYTE